MSYPPKQGLYDPFYEKDACGVGFVVDIQGRKSHKIIQQGLTALDNLRHRPFITALTLIIDQWNRSGLAPIHGTHAADGN